MADPATFEEQTAEQRAAVQLVRTRKDRAERIHKPYVDRWNEQYGQYRSYRKARSVASQARPKDRDGVLLDLKRDWGADLSLPMAFGTVETIVPRMIANAPRIVAKANDESAIEAADKVSKLMNRQQEQINYEMTLQPSARRGAIHGLGVQKTYWQEITREGRVNTPRRVLPGYQTRDAPITVYAGPQAEDVDIFDFFWDPAAKNIRTCEWVIHRTWRSMDYVASKVNSGQWFPVDLEKVRGLSSEDAAGQAWQDRMTAGGFGQEAAKRGPLHEVWEYHDRQKVITVLDRQLLVVEGANPSYYGELPFQIFRPTIVAGEFVGIGVIEPIAHLISELNQLRSHRLDGATLALNPPVFFTQGMIQEENIVYGPGVWVPTLGPPDEVAKQFQHRDVPGSGYQEADEIKNDMDRATGISDATAGIAPVTSGTTATGIQLEQSAANVRIKLMSRNLQKEMVKNAACEFFWLNRQHVTEDQTVPVDNENGSRDYVKVGPKDLWSDLDVIPDADSTEPENQPQQRQDALTLWNAVSASPVLNQKVALVHFLREYGVTDAESFVDQMAVDQLHGVGAGGGLDPNVLGKNLVAAGLPEDVVLAAMQQALQASAQTAQNGSSPQQQQPQGAAT